MTNLPLPNTPFSQNKLFTNPLYQNLKKFYNKDDENSRSGLGLSVQYIIEQRQYGPKAGSDYLLWLQSLLDSADSDDVTVSQQIAIADLEKILRHRFRHQHLSIVLEDLIRLQTNQDLNLEGYERKRDGCLHCFLNQKQNRQTSITVAPIFSEARESYIKKAQRNGLKVKNTSGNSPALLLNSFRKQNYVSFINSLKNLADQQYFLLGIEEQIMAITYQRIGHQPYWTFFDPNEGVFSYDNFNEFQSSLDKYFFGPPSVRYPFYHSQTKEHAVIEYICFSETDAEGDDGIWKNFSRHEEVSVVYDLIKEKMEFSFHKNITAILLGKTLNKEGDIISMEVEFRIHRFNETETVTLDLPFSSLQDLHNAVLRRIDIYGNLVLSNSANPLDDFTPESDFLGRAKQITDLIDKISLEKMHFSFIYKDSGIYNLFKEFFVYEHHSRLLNTRKLLSVIFRHWHKKQWKEEITHLSQIAEITNQQLSFRDLSEKARFWAELQERNFLSLSEIKMNPQLNSKEMDVSITPTFHKIYIWDKAGSVNDASALGLTWLKARKTSQEALTSFLKGLAKHYQLFEKKIYNLLTILKKRDLLNDTLSLFEIIKAALLSKPQQFFTDLNDPVLPTEIGSYLLYSKKHSFVLDITKANGEYQSTVYDPNIGELSFKTRNADLNPDAVNKMLYDYLDEKLFDQKTRGEIYGFNKNHNGEYLFFIKKINISELKNSDIFSNFQEKLSVITLSKVTDIPEIIYDDIPVPVLTIQKTVTFFLHQTPSVSLAPSAPGVTSSTSSSVSSLVSSNNPPIEDKGSLKRKNVVRSMSYFLQFYGYYHSIAELIQFRQAMVIKSHYLTLKEKNELEFEYDLAIGALGFNGIVDLAQNTLTKINDSLKLIPAERVKEYSSLKRAGFKSGKFLTRFAAPALTVLSAGWEIYYFLQAMIKLDSAEDPKNIRDLIVSAIFSALGAALSIGMGMAVLVAGSTVVSTVSLWGLLLGAGLLFGSQIYSAVSRLEELQSHIELGIGERFQNGILTFLGLPLTSDTESRYQRAVIRKAYDEKLLEQANNLLTRLSTEKIDVYFIASEILQ